MENEEIEVKQLVIFELLQWQHIFSLDNFFSLIMHCVLVNIV